MAMEIGLMICLDSLEDKNFKFYLRCGIAGFRTVFYAQTRAVELCRWRGARVAHHQRQRKNEKLKFFRLRDCCYLDIIRKNKKIEIRGIWKRSRNGGILWRSSIC